MINSGFYLDAVITVVDALHIEQHLPDGNNAAATGFKVIRANSTEVI